MKKVLANSDFRKAWGSYTASCTAASVVPTVITLIVLDQYQDIGVLGIVLAFRTLGFILGALFSGVITDAFPHKFVLGASSAIKSAATVLIVICIAFKGTWILYGSICLLGIGEGFFRSAYQAIVADIIDVKDRMAANAATTLSMRIALTVAPLIATLLYIQFDGYTVLMLSAFLWLLCLMLVTMIQMPQHANIPAHHKKIRFFADYVDGLKEAKKHRWFMAGLLALSVWLSLGFSVQQILLPVISKDTYGSNQVIGFALGSYSFGAIIASLLMSQWKMKYKGLIAYLSLSLYGLVPLALNEGGPLIWIYAAYFLGGFGIEAFNIPWFTAIQNAVPKDKLGRVSSLDFLVSYGISPLSLAFLPFFIQEYGQSDVLVFCGVATIIASLAVLLVPGALTMQDPQEIKRKQLADNIPLHMKE